jgi:hypothetical protein
MASYNNYSNDWYVTVNGGTGTFYLDAALQVSGNITYVGELIVDNAFIIAAANNSSSANVTAVGLLAGKPTSPISYAGMQYNATNNAWQISTDVFANGVSNTVSYSNIVYSGSNATLGDIVITGGNITGANVIIANVVTTNTANATGNITGANVLAGGIVSATGNITGAFFNGNGSALTGIVATGVGTLTSLSVTGNVDAGNLRTAGIVSATGNVRGANLNTVGVVSATGNIAGDNIIAIANIEAGNISTLGSISSANINLAANAVIFGNATTRITVGTVSGLSTISSSGSVTAATVMTAVGNITGGNVNTAGIVTTTPVPFANLTATSGGRAFVNNANLVAVGNFGNQISGGGSNTVPVWSDGSNWYIG